MSTSSDPHSRTAARHARGTVYGCLLNFRDALDALGDSVHQAPYKAPPKAPILYIKPRNTWAADGDAIVVPHDADELEIGISLGLVIGRTACRLTERDALDCVSGYAVVNDVSVPHASYYRPSMRFKCRDGFCPISTPVPSDAIADPNDLVLRIEIDGVPVLQRDTRGLIRPVARLLADVTDFMTLHTGDVLMIGVPGHAPRARAGQTVRLSIPGVGALSNPLVAEVRQ